MSMKTEAINAGALTGVLVIELSEVVQAPIASQMLGDLGAEVIKVERASGEILRNLEVTGVQADGLSSYFAAVNRNKQSIVLDLKSEAGKSDLVTLLKRADVFINNY